MRVRPTMPGNCKRKNIGLNAENKKTEYLGTL